MTRYDALETRSPDQRDAEQLAALNTLLIETGRAPLDTLADLAALPVLRKSDLSASQNASAPLGALTGAPLSAFSHVFQSPGPIYEPGRADNQDWWRAGRFLHACGIGAGDVVQNCFSYHLTPAGLIFDNGARAVGATAFPAGTGQTELQAQAAAHIGVTAYAGTPDYLKTILDKGAELGLDLSRLTKAAVTGGALFPSLRQEYADRGVTCLQCYATADLGLIAYETAANAPMIIDEGVIVEIVTPGTGDPVSGDQVGEVLVTTLTSGYPLVRFATGDLSAFASGVSDCGRTGRRIKGWMGRADQTAKVKGMFVRPEQVAAFTARFADVSRARVVVTRAGEQDHMALQVESSDANAADAYAAAAVETLKLRAAVEIVAPGSLPNDGKVVDDQRVY